MPRTVLGILLIVVVGCGPRPIVPVPVQGTVTLDAKPLAEGRISFITPGQVPELLDIVDGRFEGKVKPGEKRVEIAAYRPVRIPPDTPKGMRELMKDGKENYLPPRYHRDSDLSQEVQTVGANDFEFKLTSRK